jgi:hypothetical protein
MDHEVCKHGTVLDDRTCISCALEDKAAERVDNMKPEQIRAELEQRLAQELKDGRL